MPELISSSVRRGILGMGHTGRSVARHWKAQGIPFIAMDTRVDLGNDLTLRRELDGIETHFGKHQRDCSQSGRSPHCLTRYCDGFRGDSFSPVAQR
jgi:UDP-N-acetylmuramoylalanine-D-glutamate ligase